MANENFIPATPHKAGPGDYVQAAYNSALRATGGGLWKGVQSVAAGGFGRGVITAALLIGTAAVIGGIFLTASSIGPAAGIAYGLGLATNLLFTLPGAVALLTGGVIGALTMPSRQNSISATEAEKLGKQYAEARGRGQSAQGQPPLDTYLEPSLAAQVQKRRDEMGTDKGRGR